jgi:transposase-like protein
VFTFFKKCCIIGSKILKRTVKIMSKRLPTTTKKKIVKEYINGTSVQNLSTQYGVSRGSIYNWIELYDTRKSQTTQENNTTMNQRDYLRLQDKYNRAKKINEILYKANCTLDSPTVIKVAEIKRLSSEYSLSILCEALKVSKSSYYIAADENHKTTYSEKRKEMTPLIINKFNDSNQTLGAAKIAALLRMDGYEISNKLVADIMRIEGLFSMRGGANLVHSVDSSAKAVELVNKNIELNFPGDSRHQAFAADAFRFLDEMTTEYDLVVLDPPAFAKHRDALKQALRGYTKLNAKAMEKMPKGSILFTFSCSQAVNKDQFRTAIFSAAMQAGRHIRILHQLHQPADHPINIYHPEGEYLKGLVVYVE